MIISFIWEQEIASPYYFANEQSAVTPLLHNDVFQTHSQELTYTYDNTGLPCILPNLFFTHQEDIDTFDDFSQLRSCCHDPQFHGIKDCQTGAGHLLKDFHLQFWLYICQDQQRN